MPSPALPRGLFGVFYKVFWAGVCYCPASDRLSLRTTPRLRFPNLMDSRFSQRSVGGGSVPPPRLPRRFNPQKRREEASAVGKTLKAWFSRVWVFFLAPELSVKTRVLRIAGTIVGLGALYFLYLMATLPTVNEQTIGQAAQSTVITDRNGVELYRLFGEEDRTPISGDDIPQDVKDAVVAIEDRRFFTRGCIDMRALLRAVVSMGKSGGASTITRQLARNALDLKGENILNRKLKELILGCRLEFTYDREKILELYLNWIPFGQNAYGVEQASQRYFGKSAKEMTLAESAVLAGLPQLPSYYNPYGRHVHTTVSDDVLRDIASGKITTASQIDEDEVSIGLLGDNVGTGGKLVYIGGRTDQVLRNMFDQGYITKDEETKAIAELQSLEFKQTRESIRAPHFVLWTKEMLEDAFTDGSSQGVLEQGGLTIQTTLDWRLQEAAEQIMEKRRADLKKRFMADNMALLAIDPETREILAYVGNADYGVTGSGTKIDMVQVPRQPGSSFKPFIYAGAFLQGYSPATVLYDVPTKFGDYEPQNYEGSFQGIMTARQALGGSRNIPAIKAYFLGGEEQRLLALADAMGMPTPGQNVPAEGYGPAMALGAAETPLLEMVQGYATFADGGRFRELTSIVKITDRRGNILTLPGGEPEESQAIDPRIAYQITSVLSDASVRPGDYWKNILSVPGYQAAAKTGTSNKCLKRDDKGVCTERRPDNTWTMGYTPNIVVGVWVGNASSDPLSPSADGLTLAAPIWHDFMVKAQEILKENPDETPRTLKTAFEKPEGMTETLISTLSGELPTECTPVEMRRGDVFLQEDAPTLADPGCVQLTVDKLTGLLASDDCPVEAQEERSFIVPISVLESRFPDWKTAAAAWLKTRTPTIAPDGTLVAPTGTGTTFSLALAPTEKCSMALTPGRQVKPTLSIDSPSSGGSATYPAFRPSLEYTVGSTVREIRFEVDDKLVGTFTAEPFDGAIRVPRSISESGMHTLKVTLVDEYYNVVTDSVRFTFQQDTSGPQVYLTSPENNATVEMGEAIVISAEADDGGSIKYVEFYLDDLLLTRKPRSPYSLEYEPPVITAGQHEIRAVATDEAGNTTEDAVRIEVVEASTGSGSTEE